MIKGESESESEEEEVSTGSRKGKYYDFKVVFL